VGYISLHCGREGEFQQRGDGSKAVHVFIRSMSFQPWSPHSQYKTEGRCQSRAV